MSQQAALATMRDTVALWYCQQRDAADVVRAACDLLVVGVDGPAVCILAAIPYAGAERELADALEPALAELGLPYFPEGSDERYQAGLEAMASEVLFGALSPRHLACWAHDRFGHGGLALAANLAVLHDTYDELPWLGGTEDELDALVRAEAEQILMAREHR